MGSPLSEQFATIIVGPWPGSRLAHDRALARCMGPGTPAINAAFARSYPSARFSAERNRIEWRIVDYSGYYAIHLAGGSTEIYSPTHSLLETIRHDSLLPTEGEVRSKFYSWMRSLTKRPG